MLFELAWSLTFGSISSSGPICAPGDGLPDYTDEYYDRFYNRVGPTVVHEINDAAHDVGSYWYTAWLNAGHPQLPGAMRIAGGQGFWTGGPEYSILGHSHAASNRNLKFKIEQT